MSVANVVRIPPTEVKILLALLQLGVASAPEIAQAVSEAPPPTSPDTVKALLRRLESRGFVATKRSHSSRVWWLPNKKKVHEVLRETARLIVREIYGSDPLMISLLLEEASEALAELSELPAQKSA
jgi:predicted transcriptional regulator